MTFPFCISFIIFFFVFSSTICFSYSGSDSSRFPLTKTSNLASSLSLHTIVRTSLYFPSCVRITCRVVRITAVLLTSSRKRWLRLCIFCQASRNSREVISCRWQRESYRDSWTHRESDSREYCKFCPHSVCISPKLPKNLIE